MNEANGFLPSNFIVVRPQTTVRQISQMGIPSNLVQCHEILRAIYNEDCGQFCLDGYWKTASNVDDCQAICNTISGCGCATYNGLLHRCFPHSECRIADCSYNTFFNRLNYVLIFECKNQDISISRLMILSV